MGRSLAVSRPPTAPERQGQEPAALTLAALSRVVLLLAVACGLSVANLYYAQPLLTAVGRDLGAGRGAVSLAVTLTQVGYAVGLVLLVPLGDVLESRGLASTILLGTAASAALAAVAPDLGVFLAASVALGLSSVVAQVLVPVAAALAPEATRGAVVGRVVSGLLLGILLARTLANLIAAGSSWRVVYALSAALMLALAAALRRALPRHPPTADLRYPQLLASVAALLRTQPVLRERIAYQAALFATFSAFWTSITYRLGAHGIGQLGIGVFALVGAAGAAAAPVAGRLGDRGRTWGATGAALALALAAMVLGALTGSSPVLLAVAAVGLDLAVQTTLVLGQRAVYAAVPEARARANTAYIASFFLGGRVGGLRGAVRLARLARGLHARGGARPGRAGALGLRGPGPANGWLASGRWGWTRCSDRSGHCPRGPTGCAARSSSSWPSCSCCCSPRPAPVAHRAIGRPPGGLRRRRRAPPRRGSRPPARHRPSPRPPPRPRPPR